MSNKVSNKVYDVETQWGTSKIEVNSAGYGIINRSAKWAFTRGQCHALAAAIHQKTGWPIKGVSDTRNSPAHCVVWCPPLKKYIDIDGAVSHSDLVAEWGWVSDTRKVITNPNITMKEIVEPQLRGYLPPAMIAAEPFAKTVLAKVNKELKAYGYPEVRL